MRNLLLVPENARSVAYEPDLYLMRLLSAPINLKPMRSGDTFCAHRQWCNMSASDGIRGTNMTKQRSATATPSGSVPPATTPSGKAGQGRAPTGRNRPSIRPANGVIWCTLVLGLVLLALSACTTIPQVPRAPGQLPRATAPADQLDRKVLIIGVDGLLGEAVSAIPTPSIDRVINSGAWTPQLVAGNHRQFTESAPGWSTILTGVWAPKHQVWSNFGWDFNNLAQYPALYRRLDQVAPQLSTASFVHWAPINQWLLNDADTASSFATDIEVAAASAAFLQRPDTADVTFVHFDDVDHAGHECCYSAGNDDYQNAVRQVDKLVGQLLSSLETRPGILQEDWLVMVVSDHGGGFFWHGGDTPQERDAFLAIANTGPHPFCSTTDLTGVTQADVLPTVLAFLGLSVPTEWGIDGQRRC